MKILDLSCSNHIIFWKHDVVPALRQDDCGNNYIVPSFLQNGVGEEKKPLDRSGYRQYGMPKFSVLVKLWICNNGAMGPQSLNVSLPRKVLLRVDLEHVGNGFRTLAKTDSSFRNSLLIVAGVSALLLIGGFGSSRPQIFQVITETIPVCTYTSGYTVGPGYYQPPGYYCSNVVTQRIVSALICATLIAVYGVGLVCWVWAA